MCGWVILIAIGVVLGLFSSGEVYIATGDNALGMIVLTLVTLVWCIFWFWVVHKFNQPKSRATTATEALHIADRERHKAILQQQQMWYERERLASEVDRSNGAVVNNPRRPAQLHRNPDSFRQDLSQRQNIDLLPAQYRQPTPAQQQAEQEDLYQKYLGNQPGEQPAPKGKGPRFIPLQPITPDDPQTIPDDYVEKPRKSIWLDLGDQHDQT